MRRLLLGATSFLAITALDPAARATPIDSLSPVASSPLRCRPPALIRSSPLARKAETPPAAWEQRSAATLLSRQERVCRLPSVALAGVGVGALLSSRLAMHRWSLPEEGAVAVAFSALALV